MEEELPDLDPTNSDENVYNEHTEIRSFVPEKYGTEKQKLIINKDFLNAQTHELTLRSETYNEFNTEYLASLSFAALFPDTIGDLTNSYLLHEL